MQKLNKVVEITQDFEGATLEYDFLKGNNVLLFTDRLNFYELMVMNEKRCDNIEPLTEQQFYKEVFEYLEKYDKEYINDFSELHSIKVLNNYDVKDLVDEYIDNGYMNEEEIFKHFSEVFNLNFGSVGYSPGSYYIALPSVDGDFISDVYHGYNFYTITVYDVLDDNIIELYDIIGGVYGASFEELEKAVLENFRIDKDFKVIENKGIDHMKIPKERLIQKEIETIERVKLQDKFNTMKDVRTALDNDDIYIMFLEKVINDSWSSIVIDGEEYYLGLKED